MKTNSDSNEIGIKNACKLCTPLGASLAFKGIKGAIPFLHGSQGCATYIRRYLISHYKEPMDIASSNFSEETAVFGGGANLKLGLSNITKQYEPVLIGVATTCLSETIGDDVPMFLDEYKKYDDGGQKSHLVHVSTASYRGTHRNGYNDAVKATVASLLNKVGKTVTDERQVNLFPGMVSPKDIRYLKEILSDFNLRFIVLPDYSETLDGGLWSEYQKIPDGGTDVSDILKMGNSSLSIEFGRILANEDSAGKFLESTFDVPCKSMGLPVGVKETDIFFKSLEGLAGMDTPEKYQGERARLIDSYVDGHKYVAGKKAFVFGDEELVVGLASFLSEIGIKPVLCATGGQSGLLKKKIMEVNPLFSEPDCIVSEGIDFVGIMDFAKMLKPDILLGSSKGYHIAREMELPLVRVGFPIHDRVGGSRVSHLGYRGAQELFDRIANALIETKQASSDVGYSYI
ncbi:MAG: nitrogenase [Proteobacteria bacterium]|nr:nitrogenase [Pseudomonadota bacterium]